MSKTQIGWYIQKTTKTITNYFQYASAFETVETVPGKYPLEVYDMTVQSDGRIRCHANTAYARAEGTITAAYCAGDVCDEGFEALSPYLFAVAENVVEGKGDYELLPEYEAREVRFEWEGQTRVSHGIYRK